MKTFMMKLIEIRPSQLYISSEKLREVMRKFSFDRPESVEPIPIKRLNDEVIYVDGHTRAFAAFLHGLSEVLVYWEDEELDWNEYEICVEWCRKAGILTIADLKNRVVSQKDYETLWYKRCEKMQQDLARRRQKRAYARRTWRKSENHPSARIAYLEGPLHG